MPVPDLIPRLRSQMRPNRERWVAVEEESTAGWTRVFSFIEAGIRSGEPPNIDNRIPERSNEEEQIRTPPPRYSSARHLAGPESAVSTPVSYDRPTQSLVSRFGIAASHPLTSCNLVRLEDIRHEENSHSMQMASRISSVPSLPTLPEPSQESLSGSSYGSLRRASTWPNTTIDVFVSLGQLPGVEPFEPDPRRRDYQQEWQTASRSQLEGSGSVLSTPIYADIETASGQLLADQRRYSQPPPARGQEQTVLFPICSSRNLSQWRWKPPPEGYYTPQQTWPQSRQQAPRDTRSQKDLSLHEHYRGLISTSWFTLSAHLDIEIHRRHRARKRIHQYRRRLRELTRGNRSMP